MTSPEIANVLKKYVTSKPLRFGGPLSGNKQTRQNRKDFEELQALALKDMDAFNKKLNDMKAKQGDSHSAVRDVLAKAGLSKHITDNNKQTGEETMNESYKDKFNAAMKKFGINSLDDLKTDADKKKFFKHVDSTHTADHEEEVKEENLNEKKADFLRLTFANNQTVKKVDRWAYDNLGHANQGFTSMIPDEHGKSIEWEDIDDADALMTKLKRAGFSFTVDMRESVVKEEMKDLEPDAEEINAMVKDPHKSKDSNPKDDILAQWSDASVKADVKAKGGADMSKVKDKAPISASYESKKYHDIKPGSLQDAVMQMQVNEQKSVIVKSKELSAMVETYLNKGGVSRNLSPAINELWPAVALGVAGAAALGTYAYKKIKKATSSMRKPAPTLPKENKLPLQTVREFIDTYNRHFLTNFKAEEFVVSDRLNENQIKEVTEDEIVAIRVPEFSKLIETYLLKGGVIDTTSVDEDVDLDEEINALPLQEVRDFITTYNKWFLTNYKAEEFIVQVEEDVSPGHGNSRRGDAPKKVGTFTKLAKKVVKGITKFVEPAKNFVQGKGYAFDK